MDASTPPPASSVPAAPRDARQPWMGLAPYTGETRRFFFGRDAEIADIFVRVREQPLTILYGQSGLGKSSLLRAGLEPKLLVEGWRPVVTRLRFDDVAPPLPVQLGEALNQAIGTAPAEARVMTIWERLHHRASRPDDLESRAPVLIFDQFEEIFTLGARAGRQDEVAAFFRELAEAIENRPPAKLQESFEADRRLAREYDFGPGTIRFVLTLREDYLFGLDEWKKELPSLMRNRAPLRLLSGPQALEAVVRPGALDGPPLVSPEIAADIVCFVADKSRGTPLDSIGAVPPLLSLVCERLNDDRIRRRETTITAGQVASQSGSILDQFYEESFAGHPLALRHFVEDELVTERGHRAPFSREDAEDRLRREGLPDPVSALDSLLARRLITAEERAGIPWIEITHDVLAPLVVRSRDERLERERADAERRRAETIEKERRRLRRIAGAFAVLTVMAVAGMIFGWLKTRDAARERDTARHNEGLAWMLRARVALEQGNLYPDTLLYAAQAIGFDGVGRSPNLGAGDQPLRFIREDRDAVQYQNARDWIASRPAYRPLWSSGSRPDMPATALTVDPSGRWLALGSEEGVRLFELPAGGKETALPEISGVTDMAFSPDGESLAIAAAGGVRLWVLNEQRFLENPVGVVSSLAWSPDREWLAGAGEDGSVLLWKSGAGEPEVIPGGGIESEAAVSLSFSPENAFLAGVLPGAGPRIWFPDHGAAASAWVELNAEDETVAKLDERDRPEFQNRVAAASTATSVAVSPDGMTLATGTRETEFDVDGEEITRGGVILWDAAAAGIVARVSPEQRHAGAVKSVAFRTDGRQLASGAEDGTIKLWAVSADSLRLVATLTGHRGAVTRLAYGPGETLLASAGADGSAKLWDVSGQKAESLDLFAYREKRWYGFAPEVAWEEGGGFLNETAGSLVAQWRASDEPDAAAALIVQAEKAAGEKRWRRVALLEKELKALERALPEDLASGLASALPRENPKVRDSFVNGEAMELLWCPPGTFQMGSPEGEEGRINRETRHKVTLTSGFWLGQTEVTQAQWIAVMGRNPSTNKPSGLDAPVENVSWDEAMEYCRRLTDRERARGAIPAGWEYRLPTEAQWEYACRAGTETAWSFGNDKSQLHRYGNFNDATGNFVGNDASQDDKHQYTAPVKSYEANPWGFYDMHGNVWEWCLDRFDQANQDYIDQSATDPVGTRGSFRVSRGGSFFNSPADCRSAFRYANRPTNRSVTLGLRPALVPSSQPVP